MPGSLLFPSRVVSRHESTRSDRSDGSACSNTSQSSAAAKKVSFNKAVRIKKYPRLKKNPEANGDIQTNGTVPNGIDIGNGSGSPEKRFWFKVYKNKHRQDPDPREFRRNDVIYYDNDFENDIMKSYDDDISYHPNPSSLNYPVLTSECGTQTLSRKVEDSHSLGLFGNNTPLHSSQMLTDPPHVKKNHVKKIVNRFNEEAVLQRQKSSEGEISPPVSPPRSPRAHSTPLKSQPIPPPPPEPPLFYTNKRDITEETMSSRFKKNPIVNGVKVIFGMSNVKKKDKEKSDYLNTKGKEATQMHRNKNASESRTFNGVHSNENFPYKTEIQVSDGSETNIKTSHSPRGFVKSDDNKNYNSEITEYQNGGLFRRDVPDNDYGYFFDEDEERDDNNKHSKVHVETWDSGNQLVYDTTDVNTATTKTDKGELISTMGEKHQLWRNNKRIIVYEEQSPKITRRKAKSQNDLNNSEKYPKEEKVDRGISTEQLFTKKSENKENSSKKSKDSWLKSWRSGVKDKGIQCNKVSTNDDSKREVFYTDGKYKVIRPRNGIVSAYSNVPSLNVSTRKESTNYKNDYSTATHSSDYTNSAIYSQIDKTKKTRSNSNKEKKKADSKLGLFKSRSEPLYIGPPPKNVNGVRDDFHDDTYEENENRKIKTSKRSFGFRLNTGRNDSNYTNSKPDYREENWYDVDDDVEAVEQQKRRGPDHHDIAEVRQELADEEFASDVSSANNSDQRRNREGAGSVMREVDYKKREISYENVPRPDDDFNSHPGATVGSGLWFRDAEEDYRREMAQSEVSYPAGSHVGSDRFYTIDRSEKTAKRNLPPPGPRAYTLDRRHLKEKQKVPNTSGVKILVNGKEISDRGGSKKKNKSHRKKGVGEDPLSVQSDPLCVRGGLAAAYQARQRAALRRSNSSVTGMDRNYHTLSPPQLHKSHGSSEISGASSETEIAHQRRPLVMYIPGVSHQEQPSEDCERASVSRSQSMMTSSRPPKITPKVSKRNKSNKTDIYRSVDFCEEDEIMPLASETNRKKPPKVPNDSRRNSDIKRRHSMPKDTKFPWLKWRIKGKPSREP